MKDIYKVIIATIMFGLCVYSRQKKSKKSKKLLVSEMITLLQTNNDIAKRFYFGDESRLKLLKKLFSLGKENIILTRGYCSDVCDLLKRTGLQDYFSSVRDTRGNVGYWNTNEKRWDFSKISYNGSDIGSEMNKMEWIKRNVEVYAYVDDNMESYHNNNLKTHDLSFSTDLQNDLVGGLSAPENTSKLYNIVGRVSPNHSIIWDFDCTLTAYHFYKTPRLIGKWKDEMIKWFNKNY